MALDPGQSLAGVTHRQAACRLRSWADASLGPALHGR